MVKGGYSGYDYAEKESPLIYGTGVNALFNLHTTKEIAFSDLQ
jgi:hypothetical protein